MSDPFSLTTETKYKPELKSVNGITKAPLELEKLVLEIKVPLISNILTNIGLLTGVAMYKPVSYTHLRAHETVLDLVCRLLLEKKKENKTQKKKQTRQQKK